MACTPADRFEFQDQGAQEPGKEAGRLSFGLIQWLSHPSELLKKEGAIMPAVTPIAHVIINRDSGATDKSALTREIETEFKAHNWQVEFVLVGRDNLHSCTQQTVAQASGAVVVAGGDGTINAVATACVEVNRPLGILPAGTFNYVARNLRVPMDMSQAVSVIVQGQVRAIGVGEINGRIFLHNAGFGLYTRMLEQREQDVRRFGRSRLVAFLSGIRCLLSPHPLFSVALEADGQAERHLTTTLFFGCNALQLEELSVHAADCLRQQKLAVLSLKFRSRWEVTVAACAGLIGKLDRVKATEAFCASALRVQTRRRTLKVVMDGELVLLRPPLDIRFRPGALAVFAPPVVPD
jgi:diacylglycerol kinase family enzyme